MNDADLAALNEAHVLKLYDWPGGRLLAQVALGAFTARADGSASSSPSENVQLGELDPAWAELLDGEHHVLFVGPVGDA